MEIVEIIDQINSKYAEHKDCSTIVEKISHMSENFDMAFGLAIKVASSDSLNDKKIAKELYLKAIEYAWTMNHKYQIIDNLLKDGGLQDKELAKSVCIMVAEESTILAYYVRLIETIMEHYDDRSWAEEVANKAFSKIQKPSNGFEPWDSFNGEIKWFEKTVANDKGLNDKELAEKIMTFYKKNNGLVGKIKRMLNL